MGTGLPDEYAGLANGTVADDDQLDWHGLFLHIYQLITKSTDHSSMCNSNSEGASQEVSPEWAILWCSERSDYF